MKLTNNILYKEQWFAPRNAWESFRNINLQVGYRRYENGWRKFYTILYLNNRKLNMLEVWPSSSGYKYFGK